MAEETRPYEALLPQLIKIVQYPEKDELKRPGYRESVDHAEEMAVHLYGDKPEKLLERVRPREDPEIRNYRLESYEPTTKSTAEKGVSLTNKIFNPKLYGIQPADGEAGELLFNYSMVEYPVFNSIVNFLSEYGLKKTLGDPNGIFLVEPYVNPASATERIMPYVQCYGSDTIHLAGDGYFLVFIRYQESEDKKEKRWYYKYVDRSAIYNFYLGTTNTKDFYLVEESLYPHNFEQVPAWPLGGTYNQKAGHYKGETLFESFFFPAVPFWNKAICAESDLDGAFISHLHPQKWEVADECEFVMHSDGMDYACQGGYIYNPKVKGGKSVCGNCGGTGRKSVKGPYQTYQVTRDKLSDPNGNTLNQPPAGYIDVPTEATKMLDERVDKLLEKGLSALNMDIINKIGNNQSGEAKAYDRTELFDFLGKVRDLFYDKHLKNIFYFFARYMFINQDTANIEPTVIKPNDFDIFTTQELTDQLKVAKDSMMNPSYQRVKQMDVQNKEFQQHPELLQGLNLIVELDPFAEISQADIDLMLASSTASKTDVIIHNNINAFVRRALEEDKNFGEKTYTEKMEVLRGFAEEVAEQIEEENQVEIDMAAIEPEMETEGKMPMAQMKGKPMPDDAE